MRRLAQVGAGIGVATLVVAGAGCLDPNMPTLTNVTMAKTGAATDTVSFTFFDKTPSVKATYTGTTIPQGTGGRDFPFEIDGRTYVSVRMDGAVAHDLRGQGTSQHAVYATGLTSIAEVEELEDYEGIVFYVIGLNTTKAPKLSVATSGHVVKVLVTKT